LVCTPNDQIISWWDLANGKERSRYPEKAKESPFSMLLERWVTPGQRYHPPCAAASNDGHTVAMGAQAKLTCVHEVGPGKVRVLFEAQVNSISCVAFSPDDRTLATVGDEPFVLIWDVAGGKPTKQLETNGHFITALGYSPDRKYLAAGTIHGRVLLWDLATGRLLTKRPGHRGAIRQISFTPDSKLMATAGGLDTTALVWDLAALSTN
jgi:WD40 repeat protein